MNQFKIFYQICQKPIMINNKNKYNVRKFIIEKDNIIKIENYTYNIKNLNKLQKEISNQKYLYKLINSSNFINIGFPTNNKIMI
jgi:hypothetical protein